MAGALQRDSAAPGNAEVEAPPAGVEPPPAPMFDLIELFFFAYRDFVGDADRLLTRYNFGRAHHRVLYFVDRRPGLSVAELLDLLKITKQSLSRVLKDLLDQNYIEQRAGLIDRRQRLMFPTDKGEALALELAALQTRRFARALALLPEGARAHAAAFLAAMCDPATGDPEKCDPEKCDPATAGAGKDDFSCDPATGGAP
jgi:DNA-binding MarR family transcriptional regulator